MMQILQKALDWFKSLFWKVLLTDIIVIKMILIKMILIKINNKLIVLIKCSEDCTDFILWQEEMELTLVGLQVMVIMVIMVMVGMVTRIRVDLVRWRQWKC